MKPPELLFLLFLLNSEDTLVRPQFTEQQRNDPDLIYCFVSFKRDKNGLRTGFREFCTTDEEAI